MKFFDIKYLFAVFISACLVTPLTYAKPPVDQPAQVTVVDPVTVTGKVDIGNKVEISGRVETINNALKIPFHLWVTKSEGGADPLGDFYTVPVGMRLTIESVSAKITVPAGQKVYALLSFFGGSAGSLSEDYLPFQPQGSFVFGDVFISSQNLKIMLDSTSPQIGYTIHRTSNVGSVAYVLTINGYLEEVP